MGNGLYLVFILNQVFSGMSHCGLAMVWLFFLQYYGLILE